MTNCSVVETDFPYTQSYKKIPKFFNVIQSAAVPPKITHKVLIETFEFKGTNDRPLIGILKSLDFIDGNGVPTQLYYDYKNKDIASTILGNCIKSCYKILYDKNEKFHELTVDKIKGFFESTTGKESNNAVLIQMVKTFMQLKSIASFDSNATSVIDTPILSKDASSIPSHPSKDFVLTHTIVLNLPATTDQKVYDVLFKSIKENLL